MTTSVPRAGLPYSNGFYTNSGYWRLVPSRRCGVAPRRPLLALEPEHFSVSPVTEHVREYQFLVRGLRPLDDGHVTAIAQ